MTVENNTVQNNLKFKINIKGIRLEPQKKPTENTMKKVTLSNGLNRHRVTVGGDNRSKLNASMEPSTPCNNKKRKAEIPLENGQKDKRKRMDRNVKLQCVGILKLLMSRNNGKIFSEPVDPVKLNIPDYFSIISKPMDLGTIYNKLERDKYFDAEEFAADVRLTFSNAMTYNPVFDKVHILAKEFNAIFSMRWKLLEAKLKRQSKNEEQDRPLTSVKDNGKNLKERIEKNRIEKNCMEKKQPGVTTKSNSVAVRPMPLELKRKLKSVLVEFSNGKITQDIWDLIENFDLRSLKEERLESFIKAADDATLWKLRGAVKNIFITKTAKDMEPAKLTKKGCPFMEKKRVQKDTENCNKSDSIPAHRRQTVQSASAQASSSVFSDLSSERSSGNDHSSTSKLNREARHPLASDASRLRQDANGGGVRNEENSCHLSTPSTTAASCEDWTMSDGLMSPEKALRAAMLKSRFADTIFKATHHIDHDKKSDPERIRQERERLEKEKREEKARIEAEIKAAKIASRTKMEAELKIKRARQREDARIALQEMEKSVIIDDNLESFKELERMMCWHRIPMERIGLRLKADDYLDEDEILNEEEEGEIIA